MRLTAVFQVNYNFASLFELYIASCGIKIIRRQQMNSTNKMLIEATASEESFKKLTGIKEALDILRGGGRI